jgi:hypothetical protein
MLVLTRTTRRNIPEGAILHSHRLEKLKSYTESIYTAAISVMIKSTKYCTHEATWLAAGQ